MLIKKCKPPISVFIDGLGLLVLEVDAVKADVDSSFIVVDLEVGASVVDVFGLDVMTGVVVGGIVTSISRKIAKLQN